MGEGAVVGGEVGVGGGGGPEVDGDDAGVDQVEAVEEAMSSLVRRVKGSSMFSLSRATRSCISGVKSAVMWEMGR